MAYMVILMTAFYAGGQGGGAVTIPFPSGIEACKREADKARKDHSIPIIFCVDAR